MKKDNIRNFSIIAHIDHGKSTLADRILEATGAISERELKSQMLDSMELERERGITIKLNAVSLNYKLDNVIYELNLIDTPGHVDFSYEVSRSLAACEGALLVVDASQGIEAQTIANYYLALKNNLKIIPIINKIDLPNADIEKVTNELIETFGFKKEDIIACSAKTGEGIEKIIESVILNIPAPKEESNSLRALIFDSYFDSYRGVIAHIRIMDGSIKVGDKIKMMSNNATYEVLELGIYTPHEKKLNELTSGMVGYISCSIKKIDDINVGDTIIHQSDKTSVSLPGYKPMKQVVFSGIYPIDSKKYELLKEALKKLKLNDASFVFEPETSLALGFGFRCGFLGLLHMEIIKERIEREFNIEIILTSPSVIYEVVKTDNSVLKIDCPTKLPNATFIKSIKEPYVLANIYVPNTYIGAIMKLCEEKRGIYTTTEYIDKNRVNLVYELPLSEIIYDFFNKLKSCTKGYASFDYEPTEYKVSDLIKLDILLNGEIVDALSIITHKDFAYQRGRKIVENLKTIIPRTLFEIPIQASIGSKIIARETIPAMRKNVLAKCYGGDVSRKRKLLEKQKEGKKKMKQIGNVDLPSDAFLSILKNDD